MKAELKAPACLRCGGESRIELHHIVYRVNGGGNNHENLMPLCKGCHDYQHTSEDIQRHIQRCLKKRQAARLQIWQYRLKVLTELNTPEQVKNRGYKPYWTDTKTHYMSREVKSLLKEQERML